MVEETVVEREREREVHRFWRGIIEIVNYEKNS